MKPTDIAWLAGVFEGEGCISIERNGALRLTVSMTDRDIIERIDTLFPSAGVKPQTLQYRPDGTPYRQRYSWRVGGDTAGDVLTAILPWLGQRRGDAARAALEHLRTRPGTGSHHRDKTHCAEGHEYTPENTYLRPGTTHRHCRACRARWARESVARSRANTPAPASGSVSASLPAA